MALAPVIVVINQSAFDIARRLADHFGWQIHARVDRVQGGDVTFENALDHVNSLFAAGRSIVGICAAGILVRSVAPLLSDKTVEPPVLAVSDDGRSVVPLLGGHRGANRLARDIAGVLGSHAAISTAGDVNLGIALDECPAGWAIGNAHFAKKTMADILAGQGVTLQGDSADAATWLQDLPQGKDVVIHVGIAPAAQGLSFHPQCATLGVGCSRDCPSDELAALVKQALEKVNLSPHTIKGIFSIDVKADELAVNKLAQQMNLPLRFFDAARLEQETPRLENPSQVVFAEVGCHGVAEAAALAGAGKDADLLLCKQKTAHATVAIALSPAPIVDLPGRARGRLSIVGIGPGQASWRTPEVSKLIADATDLVGYGLYIDLLGPLAAGKVRHDYPLGGEEDRCRFALEQAAQGKNVALVCSGDAGIYAMGALVFELLDRPDRAGGVSTQAKRVDVICSPGISALQAAAARAGAPLGHDFCAISLSDLLTPRVDIERRIKAAAQGDFVIAFYNPVSKTRRTLLAQARDILLQHRPVDTPVLLASAVGRADETIRYRRLGDLKVDEVDMMTVVLIGSSNSKLAQLGEGARMYTPRGYARKIDGDLS